MRPFDDIKATAPLRDRLGQIDRLEEAHAAAIGARAGLIAESDKLDALAQRIEAQRRAVHAVPAEDNVERILAGELVTDGAQGAGERAQHNAVVEHEAGKLRGQVAEKRAAAAAYDQEIAARRREITDAKIELETAMGDFIMAQAKEAMTDLVGNYLAPLHALRSVLHGKINERWSLLYEGIQISFWEGQSRRPLWPSFATIDPHSVRDGLIGSLREQMQGKRPRAAN